MSISNLDLLDNLMLMSSVNPDSLEAFWVNANAVHDFMDVVTPNALVKDILSEYAIEGGQPETTYHRLDFVIRGNDMPFRCDDMRFEANVTDEGFHVLIEGEMFVAIPEDYKQTLDIIAEYWLAWNDVDEDSAKIGAWCAKHIATSANQWVEIAESSEGIIDRVNPLLHMFVNQMWFTDEESHLAHEAMVTTVSQIYELLGIQIYDATAYHINLNDLDHPESPLAKVSSININGAYTFYVDLVDGEQVKRFSLSHQSTLRDVQRFVVDLTLELSDPVWIAKVKDKAIDLWFDPNLPDVICENRHKGEES